MFENTPNTIIEKNLNDARQKLLDLTMRNRLLNHRPSKNRSIRVVDKIPKEIYDFLVIQEKSMEFLPKPEPEIDEPDILFLNDVSLNNEGALPDTELKATLKNLDKYLQTNLEEDVLKKNLSNIYQQSNMILEEQGYTVLYLALGFLEWKENNDATILRKAPLILIPVQTERSNVRSVFKLSWTGEEIYTNISLQAKLTEDNITIPNFEMSEDLCDLDKYFSQITEACKSKKDWKVNQDVSLDFFSFTKFVMYKDLDPKVWNMNSSTDHPIIQTLLDPAYKFDDSNPFLEKDIDAKLTSIDVFHVMDADPTQVVVIEEIKRGKNLVVEGPPGTGKSQTIANVIAELLASGKKILFVSEKMAALEVVKSRLDRIGIGDFCLELHSRKTNKKDVLNEIERVWKKPPASELTDYSKFKDHDKIKGNLNDYASALKKPIGKIKWTPYKMFSLAEDTRKIFNRKKKVFSPIAIEYPTEITAESYQYACSALEELTDIIGAVIPIKDNPWKETKPDQILPAERDEIKEQLNTLIKLIGNLHTQIIQLSKKLAIKEVYTITDIESIIFPTLNILQDFKKNDKQILLNKSWEKEKAEDLLQKLSLYNEAFENLSKIFDLKKLENDLSDLNNRFIKSVAEIIRFIKPSFYRIKKEVKELYQNKAKLNNKLLLEGLTQIIDFQNKRENVKIENVSGKKLFGEYWQSLDSNCDDLISFKEWVSKYHKALINNWILDSNADYFLNNAQAEQFQELIKQIETDIRSIKEGYAEICQHINVDNTLRNTGNEALVRFNDRLITWLKNLHRIQHWAHYVNKKNIVKQTVAHPLIPNIESDDLDVDEILTAFKGSFSESLLQYAFKELPALINFIGELHLKNIKRFSDLDKELFKLNLQRLAHKISSEKPKMYNGITPGSEMGTLLGEFNRKRRHMPIRKLLSRTNNLIRSIKPCFMMSPLSIAQFLDPQNSFFDVIIFDEASQVRPEDALGAIIRGKQLVVMGDTKQLPPTSFFDHIVDDVEENEDDYLSITATESILHQCRRCFPVRMLKWHYRSRHQSLIDVSNQEFYNNDLLIYPSPEKVNKSLGLTFKYLPNTVYDRGRSSVNREEAKFVAKAAIEHYKKNPKKSLGIGTFNIKQQQAILDEIEVQLKINPEVEVYFKSSTNEHCFVKNLETIQGDERDYIFISIGYGFNENKRLFLNFGPLNQDGGERRLNVLITRSRECCVVFSNFKASDLKIESSTSKGMRSFKIFLDYADNRNLQSATPISEDTDSPFEDSVYEFLTSNGYQVDKQVGSAGFRIDLAIVDNTNPGKYLLAVECDGAKYHSSPVARDRDRLRQDILENLGWSIYRIWSTDWYRNRRSTMQALLEGIEKIKLQKKTPNISSKNEQIDVQSTIKYNKTQNKTWTKNIEDSIDEYKICKNLGITPKGELHECPHPILQKAIESTVIFETPVHIDEVIRRIRDHWGLSRAGNRIREHILYSIRHLVSREKIIQKGNFLFYPGSKIPIRKRNGDPPADIDIICDEEISQTIKYVLKNIFTTKLDDLIIQTSRLFGIQATKANIQNRIQCVIDDLIKSKLLGRRENDIIELVDRKI